MKNFKLIALLLLSVTLIFSSCSKDEDEIAAPSITFSNGNTELVFNGQNAIDVDVDVSAEGEVASFMLVKMINDATGSTTTPIVIDYDFEKTSGTFRFERSNVQILADITMSTDNPKKVEYKFSLTDKEGVVKTATYTVTMNVVETDLAAEMDGMFYHVEGELHGAFDLDGDATVGLNGATTTKSMINTDAAGVTFTGAWNSGNGTMFAKVNSFDFANATVESLATAVAGATFVADVTPANNDIYIAKRDVRYYVIKITDVDAAYNTNTGGNTGKLSFKYRK